MNLALIGNSELRNGIRRNLVSFPAQVPSFTKTGDRQERFAMLYFVRGWEIKTLCDRYGLTKSTMRKAISDWTARAVAAGYIQEIYPGAVVSGAVEAIDAQAESSRDDCLTSKAVA
jgi:hypothetical protein